ncbi:MAG TPA: hypothetical protein VF791_08510 [Pyrinomonadaceae bacterium]
MFIDDSGSSAEEPIMYVAGWVGQIPTWDAFADDWEMTLAAPNPKPIDYFKHNEALALKGCFAGFTESEANTKARNLAEVVARHDVYGAVYFVGRGQLKRMIEKEAVVIRDKVHQYLSDPFYICIGSLVGHMLGSQYGKYPDEKVDFIFDGQPGSSQATRFIAQYEVFREFAPEPIKRIMGTAIAMDDKEVLPLQAADLLVGQVRTAGQLMIAGQRMAEPELLAIMHQQRPIRIEPVTDEVIRQTISTHNLAISTRRLLTIKRQHGGEKRG